MLRQTWRFFALTFTISWLLWLPAVLRSNGVELPETVGLFGMFAVLGPTIAAFVLVASETGFAGVKQLAKRAIALNFNKWWLVPTIVLPPAITLVTLAILTGTGNLAGLPDWTPPSIISALTTFLIILFIGGGLEEFGWRGYALDRLQQGSNALVASLLLGLVWGLWHLPLHFISTTTQFHIPVWQFILRTMVAAILYTWLYNNTNGSLLIAILFHAINNTSSALVPPFFVTEVGRWTSFAVLVVVVMAVVSIWNWKTLRRNGLSP